MKKVILFLGVSVLGLGAQAQSRTQSADLGALQMVSDVITSCSNEFVEAMINKQNILSLKEDAGANGTLTLVMEAGYPKSPLMPQNIVTGVLTVVKIPRAIQPRDAKIYDNFCTYQVVVNK